MATPTVASTIRAVIVDYLGMDASDVTPDVSFRDLGADSLDMVMVLLEMEEKFDLYIHDVDAQAWRTVGDAVAYVEQRLAEKRGSAVRVNARKAE